MKKLFVMFAIMTAVIISFYVKNFAEEQLTSDGRTLYFDANKTHISDYNKKICDAFIEPIINKKIYKIILEGRVDTLGGKRAKVYNVGITRKRIESVREYLKAKGFTNEALFVPVVANNDDKTVIETDAIKRGKNRSVRVDIFYYDFLIEKPREMRSNPLMDE